MTHNALFAALAATLALTLTTGAKADAWNEAMTFSSGADASGHTLIFAEGVFTADTPDQFAAFARSIFAPAGTVVVLNSPGGDALSGFDLGYAIRDFGFDTAIGRKPADPSSALNHQPDLAEIAASARGYASGECYSACALAFLGGNDRQVDGSSIYGVHQISINCSESADDTEESICHSPETAYMASQYAGAATVGYFADMGIGLDLFVQMASTAPEDISVLSSAEMVRYRVVTN